MTTAPALTTALDRIVADKRDWVAAARQRRTQADLDAAVRAASPPRGFLAALERAKAEGRYGLIAEIKKASPSRGLIRTDFDPPSLAHAYAAGGASCLSVLTDVPYFQGADAYLVAARAAVTLPVLRKDFMIDPWQVTEARALGADCILLIMACLEDGLAAELEAAAHALGMDVLIEAHDAPELDRALRLRSPLIGVNNRNLKTLQVDLATTHELRARVPGDRHLVAESGLKSSADLAALSAIGVNSFLVGESLMAQADVAAATRALLARAS